MKRKKPEAEASKNNAFFMYEIWDGKRYLHDVFPSENPREVLENTRGRRLRLIEVSNGIRNEVASYEPRYVPEEEQFGEYAEGEEEQ
jgi:hypothetical protein